MSTEEAVVQLRRAGGFIALTNWRTIKVVGSDATAFLQSRLSNDVKVLGVGQGQLTCLLDRKAHVMAYLSLHRLGDEYLILVDSPEQQKFVLEELDKYHFNEKVTFAAGSPSELIWMMQGPLSELYVSMGAPGLQQSILPEEFASGVGELWGIPGVTLVRRSFSAESGFLCISSKDRESVLSEKAVSLGLVPIDLATLDVVRIEAGVLLFGVDFSADNLLPETGLENVAASYSKGCFQGQEVLARIRTFGAPRRGMIGMLFEPGIRDRFPLGTPISVAGTEVGSLASNCFSPTLGRSIAFAYVAREERIPDRQWNIELAGKSYCVSLVTLPFYSSAQKKELARRRYNEALAEFAKGSELKAIEMLRETILLDPVFADAYEALGVILSRQDQLDEAISLMKTLEQLDPDSIMAHSNLSVFYMQKGDKEAAEDEKAKAMSIRMSILAREVAQEQQQKEDVAKKRQEAEARMDLFKQVLTIDPADFLANSGLGGALVDLERYVEALPYLENALASKANHTLTYLALAQAYEKLDRTADAIEIYRKGIAVASQRGEMTPLKDMQARLERLSAAATS